MEQWIAMSESPSCPIRLGIVGCGAISVIHGEALEATSDKLRFAACADRNQEAAKAFAARFGCDAIHTDMTEMVRAEALDGIVLATWPAHHYEHVCALIDAGVRFILCEKALTLSGPQALALMERAGAAGAVVIEGFMLRYHPIYQQLEALVRDGTVGTIDTVRSGFQEWDNEAESPDDASRKWRLVKATGGGVAFDGTCYPLHVCANLANSLPVKVAFNGNRTRYDTLARLHGYIRYENGVTGLIQSSLRAVVCKEAEVSGTKGSLYLPIAFGFNVPEWVAIRKRTGHSNLTMRNETITPPAHEGEHRNRLSSQRQLEHFGEVIRRRAKPHIPLIESVVNMFTMDAVIRSAETESVVPVELPAAVRHAWQERFGN
jgi:predicted dehydrogenase